MVDVGRPGRAYNAVNDDTFTVREIAEAASRGAGAGGATANVPADILGPFGECLALDQRISAERAKADLGWVPRSPSLIEELESGSYPSTVRRHLQNAQPYSNRGQAYLRKGEFEKAIADFQGHKERTR